MILILAGLIFFLIIVFGALLEDVVFESFIKVVIFISLILAIFGVVELIIGAM